MFGSIGFKARSEDRVDQRWLGKLYCVKVLGAVMKKTISQYDAVLEGAWATNNSFFIEDLQEYVADSRLTQVTQCLKIE